MRKRGWRVCPLTEHTLPWGPPREEEEVVVRGKSPLVLAGGGGGGEREGRAEGRSYSKGSVVILPVLVVCGLQAALHRPPSVSVELSRGGGGGGVEREGRLRKEGV